MRTVRMVFVLYVAYLLAFWLLRDVVPLLTLRAEHMAVLYSRKRCFLELLKGLERRDVPTRL